MRPRERTGRKGVSGNTGGSSATPNASTHRMSRAWLRPLVYMQDPFSSRETQKEGQEPAEKQRAEAEEEPGSEDLQNSPASVSRAGPAKHSLGVSTPLHSLSYPPCLTHPHATAQQALRETTPRNGSALLQ